jgi:carbamoyl-phosphate synthase large subunit
MIGGIMEHIEQAGVHSGDSACSLPPYSLSPGRAGRAARQTEAMARALNVVGLMNVQFAIQDEGDEAVVYVLEVNPRASRTVPFVSKATGLPLAKIAARCMAGRSAGRPGRDASEVVPPYFSVKEAVFPFNKFPGVDTILGPEMKSTGEVMGVGRTFGEAFVKSQLAAGVALPTSGKAFISVRRRQGRRRSKVARELHELGFRCGHARHRARDRSGRHAGERGQQGRRGPAAHRRHDQERRDRADRQHGRGEAQAIADSRSIRTSGAGVPR